MEAKKQQQQQEEDEEAGDSQDGVNGKKGKGHPEVKTEEKPEVRWITLFLSLHLLSN